MSLIRSFGGWGWGRGDITETSFNKIKIETNLGESKEVYHNYYYFYIKWSFHPQETGVFVSLNEVIFGSRSKWSSESLNTIHFCVVHFCGSITAPLVYH